MSAGVNAAAADGDAAADGEAPPAADGDAAATPKAPAPRVMASRPHPSCRRRQAPTRTPQGRVCGSTAWVLLLLTTSTQAHAEERLGYQHLCRIAVRFDRSCPSSAPGSAARRPAPRRYHRGRRPNPARGHPALDEGEHEIRDDRDRRDEDHASDHRRVVLVVDPVNDEPAQPAAGRRSPRSWPSR